MSIFSTPKPKTKRIRFLTSVADAHKGYTKGDEADWPDAEDADRLIAAGYAEEVVEPPAEPRAGRRSA